MGPKENISIGSITERALIILAGICVFSAIPATYADVDKAYEHEYQVMDQYHSSFDVYADLNSGGNHFYPTGFMGEIDAVGIDPNCEESCHSGTTCMKITYRTGGQNWAGVYWQEPENNWGTIPNAGYDLSGATELTFWAKGENGGERVEFFVGGIRGSHPDSSTQTSTGYLTLTHNWQKYTVNVASKDLNYVIGGFGWVTNNHNNPNGATFYLDDIKYNHARSDELRFLRSYEVLPGGDPNDRKESIENTAFIYDNAVALLSFLARANEDDLRRATLLADAFVYALHNDRFYQDGRLRNAYISGDLREHFPRDVNDYSSRKTRLPGSWDTHSNMWIEDPSQISTHTGHLAWVMIALLEYSEQTDEIQNPQYLEAAKTIGEWIDKETKDEVCAGGYTGGYHGSEPNAVKITWKSTEHNITTYVAFMRLYEVTSDSKWLERATHAIAFVDAMWNSGESLYWAGTVDDQCTPNYEVIPVHIHALATMAFSGQQSALSWAEIYHYTEADGFAGFDYDTDNDGIWFEGTAQMALAYQVNGLTDKADGYISELQKAQTSGSNNNGKGMVAASHDGVTTGMDWKLLNRVHVGTTAWYIFTEHGYNPYWGTTSPILPHNVDEINDNLQFFIQERPERHMQWTQQLKPR